MREQTEVKHDSKLTIKGFKYLPHVAGESSRTYLLVAINRATRWIYLEWFSDKSVQSAQLFVQHAIQAAPFKMTQLLTDKGQALADRFSVHGGHEPTGSQLFDQARV